MKVNKILIVIGILSVIFGFFMIMKGNLVGIVLFLVGASLGVVALMRVRSAAGYENDDFGFHGIGGTGRQQTEVSKKEKERI